MKRQFLKVAIIIFSLIINISAAEITGDFEILHYDITGCSRLDGMGNSGYSFNCGISSVFLNPSMINDLNSTFKRFGLAYGFVYTPENSSETDGQFYYQKYSYTSSLKKHHMTFMVPELCKGKNFGGIGIDWDYLNTIENEMHKDYNYNSEITTVDKSNLLTFAYGISLPQNEKIIHFAGISTKIDFYNRSVNFINTDQTPAGNGEGKLFDRRFMGDFSYGLKISNCFHFAMILRNIPLKINAHKVYPLQILVPVSYTFNFSEMTSFTPEICYQHNNSILDFHYFSSGSEFSIKKLLFLRFGLTLKVIKLDYMEYESIDGRKFETEIGYSSGIGLNLFRQLSIDCFYKNWNRRNYFGFTATFHEISDFQIVR